MRRCASLETSEEWLIQTFIPEPTLQEIVAQERQPFLRLLMKTERRFPPCRSLARSGAHTKRFRNRL